MVAAAALGSPGPAGDRSRSRRQPRDRIASLDLSSPTLDMLTELGVADEPISQGLIAPKLQYRTKPDGVDREQATIENKRNLEARDPVARAAFCCRLREAVADSAKPVAGRDDRQPTPRRDDRLIVN